MFNKKKKQDELEQEIKEGVDTVDDEEEELSEEDLLTKGFEDEEEEGTGVKKKKLPGWVIIPVVLIFLAIGGIGVASSMSKSRDSGTAVDVVKVEKQDIKQIYNTTGIVGSETEKVFYSPVTAPIKTCKAEVGTQVKSGDLLITYDTTDLEKDNREAQLNLQSAYNSSQATKQQNAQAIAEAQKAVNEANQELADAANELADEANQLGARASKAKAQYEANQKTHNSDRVQNQLNNLKNQIDELTQKIQDEQDTINRLQEVVSGMDSAYNEAKTTPEANRTEEQRKVIEDVEAFQDAKVNLPKDKDSLTKLQAQYTELDTVDDAGYPELYAQYQEAYAEWQKAYNSAMKGTGSSSETGMSSAELANLGISDNLAELAAMTPQQLLEKGREGMKAEFDGIISDVKAVEGGQVAQGEELFTIVDNKNVNVELEVPANDFENLVIGGTAEIKVGQFTYKGTVESVSKIAIQNESGNSVINAKVHIDNPDEDLFVGVSAKVALMVAEKDKVLSIPNEVVNTSTDGDYVYIIKDGKVKKQNIELGIASTSRVEVVSGLTEKDQVISDTSGTLKEGTEVTASEADDEADSEDDKE